MAQEVWGGPPERLDRVLPSLQLARSRSQAAELIANGQVRVDGVVATKAGAKVAMRSSVQVTGGDHYVSRAAHKLLAGLTSFAVDPSGLLALDVGASTGGFTQVLLERGARAVIALDVGHGQLVNELREDARVRVVEGCNARELTPNVLAEHSGVSEQPDVIVADISFISLELVLPALVGVAGETTEFILLIKPQFEVGRQGIKDGIVVDTGLASHAVVRVLRCAAELGLQLRGARLSPITGEHGNREVLVHFVRGEARDQTEWEQRISTMFEAEGEA